MTNACAIKRTLAIKPKHCSLRVTGSLCVASQLQDCRCLVEFGYSISILQPPTPFPHAPASAKSSKRLLAVNRLESLQSPPQTLGRNGGAGQKFGKSWICKAYGMVRQKNYSHQKDYGCKVVNLVSCSPKSMQASQISFTIHFTLVSFQLCPTGAPPKKQDSK